MDDKRYIDERKPDATREFNPRTLDLKLPKPPRRYRQTSPKSANS
jgi:hypothetical protein